MNRILCYLEYMTPGLAAGALAEFFPEREIILAEFLLALGAVYVFIYRGREDVKRIYNRDMA